MNAWTLPSPKVRKVSDGDFSGREDRCNEGRLEDFDSTILLKVGKCRSRSSSDPPEFLEATRRLFRLGQRTKEGNVSIANSFALTMVFPQTPWITR
jgi:hypothetical protein